MSTSAGLPGSQAVRRRSTASPSPTVLVHGGAWAFPDKLDEPSLAGVRAAASEGFRALEEGRSALDAVVAAVVSMESDPVFDAGCGSVLNADGRVEMDALVVDGDTTKAGAVCGVSNALHPVELARLVMTRTEHAFLAGEGANRFAKEMEVEEVPEEELVTEESRRLFTEYQKYGHAVGSLFNQRQGHDTVGAVAIDSLGRMAAATSTGGIPLKKVGRVGDSPLIGCGAWARSAAGGCSTTGHGESIMRVLLARDVIMRAELYPVSLQEAAVASLRDMQSVTGGCGGVVALDPDGNAGVAATTEKMPWALRSSDERGLQSGLRASSIDDVRTALSAQGGPGPRR